MMHGDILPAIPIVTPNYAITVTAITMLTFTCYYHAISTFTCYYHAISTFTCYYHAMATFTCYYGLFRVDKMGCTRCTVRKVVYL